VLYLSSSAITCSTPAAVNRGPVAVEASINGGADFTSDRQQYVYEAAATASRVALSSVSDQGALVTVSGSHFEDSEGLSCRFGRFTPVQAVFVSPSSVVCLAPRVSQGNLSVSVCPMLYPVCKNLIHIAST
jgi:hypothetical protein